MTELAWSLGVFASFVAGFGAGAFLVALGNRAGLAVPSPFDERMDAFLTVLESERSVHP